MSLLPYDDSLDAYAQTSNSNDATVPKPHVKIIVDGKSVFMPGMKTYFVDDDSNSGSVGTTAGESVVGGQYCSCDTVVVGSRGTLMFCPSDASSSTEDSSGSGNSDNSGSSGNNSSSGGQTCTCDTVNTCSSNCGCVNYTSGCSCVNYTSGGGGSGGSVSCGSPCACVPVH